ncbi:MAG: hypothetical protein KJ601_03900 [Nanoarchaeota archaeon]|nr:hypothetical protein [Nanoarchaeota archaeon]MBU1704717.1 hypothetical protein [Nanoarchaeota archaeon]
MTVKLTKILKELNSTIVTEEVFVRFLYAVIIYLSLLLVISLTTVPRYFAIASAMAYFITVLFIEAKKDKIQEVEDSYPNLREEITTARDNIGLENPIVDELKKEIKEKVKYVRSSTFFPVKRVVASLIVIVLLSFALVTVTAHSLQAKRFLQDDLPGMLAFLGQRGQLNGTFNDSYKTNITEDIYGNLDVLQLGNQEINIRLMPSSYEVSVREEGEFKGKTFDKTYITDPTAESGDTFEENIPKEQQDLVKNYFLKLAEG